MTHATCRGVTRRTTSRALMAAALGLSACGGGGSGDAVADASGTVTSVPAAFAGTAYLKTRNTVHYRGRDRGLARESFQAQIDQCNSLRALYYGLAAVAPPDATLASLDVSVHEKFFDTDRALTLVTGTSLTLTDMPRWLKDATASAATGAYPAVPMDCAEVRSSETRTATLWRDGIRYQLRYDALTAVGTRLAGDAVALAPSADFAALPGDVLLGQSCRIVTAPAGSGAAAGSSACVWDAFPYAQYLNWPFALRGDLAFGTGTALIETVEPLAIERGRAMAAARFEIPAGFTTTLLGGTTP